LTDWSSRSDHAPRHPGRGPQAAVIRQLRFVLDAREWPCHPAAIYDSIIFKRTNAPFLANTAIAASPDLASMPRVKPSRPTRSSHHQHLPKRSERSAADDNAADGLVLDATAKWPTASRLLATTFPGLYSHPLRRTIRRLPSLILRLRVRAQWRPDPDNPSQWLGVPGWGVASASVCHWEHGCAGGGTPPPLARPPPPPPLRLPARCLESPRHPAGVIKSRITARFRNARRHICEPRREPAATTELGDCSGADDQGTGRPPVSWSS